MNQRRHTAWRVTYNAPVVLSFSLLCVAVWLLDLVFPLQPYFTAPSVLFPADPWALAGLITHCVGHVSWNHLLGNLSFILLLGPLVEEKYGSLLLLCAILFTALFSGLLNALFFSSGLLGASGVVFMLIVLSSTANSAQGEIPLTFVLVVFLYLGREAVDLFQEDSVSQAAHLIGGACGGAFGFLLRKSRPFPQSNAKQFSKSGRPDAF